MEIHHSGPCHPKDAICPYSPLYQPVCGTDHHTYANLEALTCRNVLTLNDNVGFYQEGQCECKDPCWRAGMDEWGHNPVCASNGFTYSNIGQVICLQSMDSDVTVCHDGGCSVEEVKNILGSQNEACHISRTHIEWNPVCGEDDTTYPNPFVMLCYNPLVQVKFAGECISPIHRSCQKAASDNRNGINDTNSFLVCGSDGMTYNSIHELICEGQYNKYLCTRHIGPCTQEDDPCLSRGTDGSHLIDQGIPVCGSDGFTYVTPSALFCVKKNHNSCLKIVHDGICLPNIKRFHLLN
ncbi:unnamed protein product [Timema podura]|uniref:Kazal-like domain-containing protein n=1 Tax=Timema podura TaxID=61482 RepID=A0ABN7P2X3_TIMPD|nr:unnamed protein product [Timema podura]